MSGRAPLFALLIALGLVAGAAVSLTMASHLPAGQAAHEREFQEVVGGLGFGPATDLAGDPSAFDPRISPHCTGDLGPLPVGGVFSPEHACSIFAYPPLDERVPGRRP